MIHVGQQAAATQPDQTGTWGISPIVRRHLARTILDLRSTVEEDFRKQLAALGVRPSGIVDPSRPLEADEPRARALALGVVERDRQAGAALADAVESYVRASAFTFLDRMVGLRCLDERGLLLVNGQVETAVKQDPARSASSLYWRVRNELPPTAPPREVWRETLRRAGSAISERIRVLFDPTAEHAALLPTQPVLQQVVRRLNVPEIPAETWRQDEVLGWVYQYYNTADKQAAYDRLARGKKLETPEELSAATCLYTERYMVDYLLQNTLGAFWVEMHPDSRLPEKWPYYVCPPEGSPVPVREPKPLRSVTLMDPACGSGHFLVRAFGLLEEMYREEGREAPADVAALILEQNLYGVDIDARAVQIAALALYLRACATAGPDFRPRKLNLVSADVRLAGDAPAPAYLARFTGDPELEALVKGVWQGLKNGRDLGSLLHPERAVDAVVEQRRARERGQLWEHGDEDWARWKHDLLTGLREEFERQAQSEDLGQRLFGEEAAKGVSLVEALGARYDVVVMNPPYAGSRNLPDRLKTFVEKEYKEGKRDLYAAFIQRCQDFAQRGGYVGMVTQQSWLFLRSFAALRAQVLERASVTTLAHLGPRAFEEISGEVVNIALFALRTAPPSGDHHLTAFRLVGPKSPADKDALLRRGRAGSAPAVVSAPRQANFLAIPETPFVYWLRPRFFELLQSERRLRDIAEVRRGLGTQDDERFTRCFWEVRSVEPGARIAAAACRWRWFVKGGGYKKWAGLEATVVDWGEDGAAIKDFALTTPGTTHWSRNVRSPSFYFRPGLTYSRVARGSMAAREMIDSIFATVSYGVFATDPDGIPDLAGLLCTRVTSYLLRVVTQDLNFESGYVDLLPVPGTVRGPAHRVAVACTVLKLPLVGGSPVERTFRTVEAEPSPPSPPSAGEGVTLAAASRSATADAEKVCALLHALEGVNERLVCEAYELDAGDVAAIVDETGTPAGWYPLIAGYDATPDPPAGMALELDLAGELQRCERTSPSPEDCGRLKARLRALYVAGPGSKLDVGWPAGEPRAGWGSRSAAGKAQPTGQEVSREGQESSPDEEADGSEDEGADEAVALGARIPIPTETFLEELSQKMELHPISVYWLLQEMREQEGLVCPPELKRHLEDYASISLLRLLGYRWPEQDAYEAAHGPILDPALVVTDGIIPLVSCDETLTAAQRLRLRLERGFGEEGAAQSEQELRQWVGRSLGDWLTRDFFKRHVQQFKQRPIAWHLVSPERTFEALVLYHRLSLDTLRRLRTVYAGGLVSRLTAEQARARQAGHDGRVTELQIQIEDVEEFRARLEKIERGDELTDRIRCRWKGETEQGRPGPYAPDIDDGVKVNMRPFQEAGLLAMREVMKKW